MSVIIEPTRYTQRSCILTTIGIAHDGARTSKTLLAEVGEFFAASLDHGATLTSIAHLLARSMADYALVNVAGAVTSAIAVPLRGQGDLLGGVELFSTSGATIGPTCC